MLEVRNNSKVTIIDIIQYLIHVHIRFQWTYFWNDVDFLSNIL